jgi:hypothetical protein
VRVQLQSVVCWSITQPRGLIHSIGAINAALSPHDELPESMQLLARKRREFESNSESCDTAEKILSESMAIVPVTLDDDQAAASNPKKMVTRAQEFLRSGALTGKVTATSFRIRNQL